MVTLQYKRLDFIHAQSQHKIGECFPTNWECSDWRWFALKLIHNAHNAVKTVRSLWLLLKCVWVLYTHSFLVWCTHSKLPLFQCTMKKRPFALQENTFPVHATSGKYKGWEDKLKNHIMDVFEHCLSGIFSLYNTAFLFHVGKAARAT